MRLIKLTQGKQAFRYLHISWSSGDLIAILRAYDDCFGRLGFGQTLHPRTTLQCTFIYNYLYNVCILPIVVKVIEDLGVISSVAVK